MTGRAAGRDPDDARELLGQLHALASSMAPVTVRRTRDPKGFVRLEAVGRGRRALPGGRPDEREHRVTLAYDGAFLQMAYRVGDRLHDSRLLSFPTTADLPVVEAFLRKAFARVAGVRKPREAAPRGARRGARGSGRASGGR